MRNDVSTGGSVQALSEVGTFVSDAELGDELYEDGGLELICEDDQLKSDLQASLSKGSVSGEGPW